MSDIDEILKNIPAEYSWLKDTIKDFLKAVRDLNFRIGWLENFQLRQLMVIDMILTDEQKDTDKYLSLVHLIHQHVKRFNPESYEENLSSYRAVSEQRIIKLGVHPEEQIEKLRKTFDLEDIPKIVTFDFIKTHFGVKQLEIYKKILEEDKP